MVIHTCGHENLEKYRKYFTIDTRSLTAPVLSGYCDFEDGNEYLYINNGFYENQEEGTLDYQIEGIEIYGLNYVQGSNENESKYKITYTYSVVGTGHVSINSVDGSWYYMARVYATNAEGEKVYSDFSDVVAYGNW